MHSGGCIAQSGDPDLLYVRWHMQGVWRRLLFAVETYILAERHPVYPAQPTPQVKSERPTKRTGDGWSCPVSVDGFLTQPIAAPS